MRPTAYRRNAHGLRDRQAFERIRLQAGELFAAGRSQAEVARDLGVAPAECQPLACLLARWRAGRIAQRRPNRACPRLSDLELAAIRQALRQGVRVNGFNSDHWTLARITTVIERVTGVAYHPGRVWKLLRRRLGWWLQRPARRHRTRRAGDRPVGGDRLATDPGNARRRRAVLVFWDESGVSLLPVTCRTWVPRGHTPVLRHRSKWQRMSMAGALCYGSHGGGAALAFHRHPGAYNTDSLIAALEQLRRSLAGRRRPWCGTGCLSTAARRCGPGCAASGIGWWWSRCLATRPSSIRSRRYGPTSKGWSWPTWPATPSMRSSRRPSVASNGSGAPTTWPTRFCVTAA
jgi:transposase